MSSAAYHRRREEQLGYNYDEMFKAQKGKCAICLKRSDKRLHVDHNHKSGKVRGLLCSKCNMALGLLDDSIRRLGRARKYLAGVITL